MAGRVRQRAVKVPGATFHCVSPGPPSGCPFPRPRPIQILAVKLVLIHQHPHGTTADANPVLLASVAGFPQWLWETDPPPFLGYQTIVPFSPGAVIIHGCLEAREQSHFVSTAKQDPAWHPGRQISAALETDARAGPARGCPPRQPGNPGHAFSATCPDVSNL